MTLEEFEAALSDPAPAYVVKAGDQVVLDRVKKLVLDRVAESARTFDWTEFDLSPSESESLDVVSTAQTLPWMSSHRWIWIRSAERGTEGLTTYLKKPASRTVVILELSGRKPKGWPRIPVVELKGVDPVRWLVESAQEQEHGLELAAARSLVELIGEDLSRLRSELDKLILFTLDEKLIRRADVLEVCAQTSESDVFELIAGLASGKADQALLIVSGLMDAGIRLPQVLGILYWNFRRLIVARELMQARRPFYEVVKELKIWSYRNQQRSLERMSRERLIELFLKLKRLEVRMKSESVHERDLLEGFVVDACLRKSL